MKQTEESKLTLLVVSAAIVKIVEMLPSSTKNLERYSLNPKTGFIYG